MAYYSKEFLMAHLPRVGDELFKVPVIGKSLGICSGKMRRCKVIFVNREHLWYMVQFASGYREIFRVPEIVTYVSDQDHRPRRVRCIETDVVYDSIKEAAKATKCNNNSIISVCRGGMTSVNGLHWQYVD